jgi:hypothetical protein
MLNKKINPQIFHNENFAEENHEDSNDDILSASKGKSKHKILVKRL